MPLSATAAEINTQNNTPTPNRNSDFFSHNEFIRVDSASESNRERDSTSLESF